MGQSAAKLISMPKGVYLHKTGYKRPPFSNEWKQAIAHAVKGNKSHWLGENASYRARHRYFTVRFGNVSFCSICEKTDRKRYEWANTREDGQYTRNIDDYIRLCHSCHIRFDRERGMWGKTRKLLEGSTTIINHPIGVKG